MLQVRVSNTQREKTICCVKEITYPTKTAPRMMLIRNMRNPFRFDLTVQHRIFLQFRKQILADGVTTCMTRLASYELVKDREGAQSLSEGKI